MNTNYFFFMLEIRLNANIKKLIYILSYVELFYKEIGDLYVVYLKNFHYNKTSLLLN